MTNIVVEPDINNDDDEEEDDEDEDGDEGGDGGEADEEQHGTSTLPKPQLSVDDTQNNAEIMSCKATLTSLDAQIMSIRSVNTCCSYLCSFKVS